ncbi:MAG: glutamate synthase [Candidatus Latescibacteria bacterium]|nr:glutamate synthase [Candidatus Latescibacterota bacterium]
MTHSEQLLQSRAKLIEGFPPLPTRKEAEEGGCGVTGFACTIPVRGRHIFEPSVQMHNRGNGKGGGIAAVGFEPDALGVSSEILETDYLLQIALLDPAARDALEQGCILPFFRVDKSERLPTVSDFREVEGLDTKPPDVWRYFVRVKPEVLRAFVEKNGLQEMDLQRAEDEFVYQNTFRLNQRFYASLGEKKAFVLSHGRNMMILKIVGYAEKIVQYYQLENFKAHVWIAHQRYPTKGRVWHPGGAHPFIGMDEALVHNGDFANYHSVSEYLRQRNIYPQFLTDTEVSILLFDLWNRVYQYPLEYIIEALAPTMELDFDQLPPEKQRIYRAIQAAHIHGSPDGPWFFIIARNEPYKKQFQLLGITDTSMLRPQVFALLEGEVSIGLVCSEKQAIDATLHSLSQEDKRFCPIADKYWNARGGSHTDGGAFMFTLGDNGNGEKELVCTDKFGNVISTRKGQTHCDMTASICLTEADQPSRRLQNLREGHSSEVRDQISDWDYDTLRSWCQEMGRLASEDDAKKAQVIEELTELMDRRYDTGTKKRSSVLRILREELYRIFAATPVLGAKGNGRYRFVDWERRQLIQSAVDGGGQSAIRNPQSEISPSLEKILIINAEDFPPEGADCDSRWICDAYRSGWRRFIAYGYKGQRFCGCGLGPDTHDVRIDVYGSSGDYLASGIDGLELHVHGDGQDQLGQIMKTGKLVVHGDVGQTFMYGAKGGEVYVLGNAAGRPLINAVGRPRVVINGTCLDYLAESFMAGDPLNGGGFVVLNGMTFDEEGRMRELPTPYPGGNLFSLASGGAIYLRDPHGRVVEAQLNGGEFSPLTRKDWALILPYLEENERLFGISIERDLLTVDGVRKNPEEVYRKVRAVKLAVLTEVTDGD